MRGLLAIPVLVLMGAASVSAEGPSASAHQTLTVSGEVVRPCAIEAQGGSATVTCGRSASSPQATTSNAPKALVTESGQSADSTVTVQF